MDGGEDLGRRPLDHIAHGTGLEHFKHARLVLVARERHDPGARQARPDFAGRPRATSAGHAAVKQRDIRLIPAGQLDGLAGVGGHSYQLQGGVAKDKFGQRAQEQRVVVGHEHPATPRTAIQIEDRSGSAPVM